MKKYITKEMANLQSRILNIMISDINCLYNKMNEQNIFLIDIKFMHYIREEQIENIFKSFFCQ